MCIAICICICVNRIMVVFRMNMYLFLYLCEQNNGGIQENGGWEGTQLNVRSAGTDSISPPLYSSILSTQQTQWHEIQSCRYKYKLQSTILIHLVDGTKKNYKNKKNKPQQQNHSLNGKTRHRKSQYPFKANSTKQFLSLLLLLFIL